MNSSLHFPVLMLIILLAGAVFISLSDKHKQKILMVAMSISWCLSLAIVIRVFRYGSFSYYFGNWSTKIGIQFIANEFSGMTAFFIMTLAVLIMVYALKDLEREIQPEKIHRFYTLVLILLFSMLGVVFTNDMFNLYVFMEILSITSCSIISIKSKKENYAAALRYLLLNTIGSLSFLLGIALLYMVSGHLNITELNRVISLIWQEYPTNILVAAGFMVTGLGIKAAVFPLHIWLPDAHSTAPTPSSALLSGLVVKVYIIAIMKIMFNVLGKSIIVSLNIPIFFAYFAAAGMIMGSIFAIGQKDIKRMLAYSSVAQIGYIFLGLGLATSMGITASVFHIFSHGLMKTVLFLSAGAIIYHKGIRNLKDLDGIAYEMPVTMISFTAAAFGMIGVPGIVGFMSKYYLGLAVLDAGKPVFLGAILISSFLNAVYYMPVIISAFLKEGSSGQNMMKIEKLPLRIMLPMVIIAVGCIIIGFYPQLIINFIEKAVLIF